MSRESVVLRGLQPQPLASYLSAIGLLRSYAAQENPRVTGAWSTTGFVLCGVDEGTLLDFLVERFEPTPIVSPWAGGSGFSEGDNTEALEAIRRSSSERLRLYRAVIEQVMRFPELPPRGLRTCDVLSWAMARIRDGRTKPKERAQLERLIAAGSQSTGSTLVESLKQGHPVAKLFTIMKAERRASNKHAIVMRCRNELPEACLGWIDAAMTLRVDLDGEIWAATGPLAKDAEKPRLDFSRLFMEAVRATLLGDKPRARRLARGMLFNEPCAELVATAAGLFALASAGGFNMGPGFSKEDLPNNPWTLVLMLEGVSSWSGAVSRRAGAESMALSCVAPFTTRHAPVGPSSSDADRQNSVTEIWGPIWERPTTAAEVLALLGEGRGDVAGHLPANGLEFAEAAGSLGVDRGIAAFGRFAVVERRSKSYVAVPLGHVAVLAHRGMDLLAQLRRILDEVDHFIRGFGDNVPAEVMAARRAIDVMRWEAIVTEGVDAFLGVIRAIGRFERNVSHRDPRREPRPRRPFGGLSEEWIQACGDSVEVRIAAAISSLSATRGAAPFRAYVAHVDPKHIERFAPSSRALAWSGADLSDRLANVFSRRLLDHRGGTDEGRAEVLAPTWGASTVFLDDVAAFLTPNLLDERVLEELVFGFTWVTRARGGARAVGATNRVPLSRAYALLKLVHSAVPLDRGGERVIVPPDPAVVAMLRAGRVGEAVARATALLRAKGLRARRVIDRGAVDLVLGRRLAAALMFPVHQMATLMELALLPAADAETERSTEREEI